MRVLVTGGTGFLGRAIVGALTARGHAPVVFARRARSSGLSATCIDGDVRNGEALIEAARGCDAICHTAALVSIQQPDPSTFVAVNVGGLERVLAAAHAHGIARIVYTSSFVALPPHGTTSPLAANDYQRTKAAAEAVAERAAAGGAPIARLYPGVVYGPGPRTEGNLVGGMIADHLRRRLPALVGGDRIWSFAYVDDVARAHVSAVERHTAGAKYSLGGENLPQRRVFEIVRDLTGRRVPRDLPLWAARVLGSLEELRTRTLGGTPRLTRSTVDILAHDWPLDSTPAMRELGYTITPLAEGVQRVLADLRQTRGPTR